MSHPITHRYDDPLAAVWLACARSLGFTVVRSDEVYASFDGERTLRLCRDASFDADDSLAQLIFHELCHGLVAGDRNRERPDWGLENVDERDLVLEHACHRVQAALADQYGLRGLFPVTTEWRTYWDALPIDPLAPGPDPAIALARAGYRFACEGPWALALQRALSASAQLAEVVRCAEPPADSLWALTRPMHRTGFPLAVDMPDARCGDCAWSAARGQQGLVCQQALLRAATEPRPAGPTPTARVTASEQACVRFEPRLVPESCGSCAACCREGFDRVELRLRDRLRTTHPELVSHDGFGAHLARPGGRCVALQSHATGASGTEGIHYRCRVYGDRPRACAELAIGGQACLIARRRVGLSA